MEGVLSLCIRPGVRRRVIVANTTDMLITSFFDEDAIEFINKETGLNFKQVSDGELAGGPKVLSFESFGSCQRSLGIDKISELIAVFKKAPFESPEYAVLLINDDDGVCDGIVTIDHKSKKNTSLFQTSAFNGKITVNI